MAIRRSAFLTFSAASYLFMLAQYMDRGQGDHGSAEWFLAIFLSLGGASLLSRRNSLRHTVALTVAFLAIQPVLSAGLFWGLSWIHCSHWFLGITEMKNSMLPCNCATPQNAQDICGG